MSSFVYQADADLFAYMRRRPQRKYLRQHGLVMQVGPRGTLMFSSWRSPYIGRIHVQASGLEDGRVLFDVGFREYNVSASFAVFPCDMVNRWRAAGRQFGATPLPRVNRDDVPAEYYTRKLTPYAEQARLVRAAKSAQWRAWYLQLELYEAILARSLPTTYPEPYVPRVMTPEEIALREGLVANSIRDILADEDARFIRTVQAMTGTP